MQPGLDVPPAGAGVLVRRARPLLGTIVAVTCRGEDAARLDLVTRAMFVEIERLQGLLSEFDPRSAVAAVNAQAGIAPVRVPREVLEVLGVAARVAARTGGAFDPTWRPLADLWDFDAPAPRVPGRGELAAALRLVAHRDLLVDPEASTVMLRRRRMRIALGGVAKAYVAERAAELATAAGVPDVLVDAGGDVVARGANGDRPWTVAIRDPRAPGGVARIVRLRDAAVATSGDSERSFVLEGRRYHHLLDPRTGYPAEGARSVTVVARHGAEADAWATALFVLGPRRGAPLVRGVRGLSAMWIAGD